MADIKKIVLTVLASCLLAITVSEDEDMLLINYHIHITNDLPFESPANDVPTLYLHCKSKDDDLGEKAMYVSDDYTWDAKINFVRTTLFFCNARWMKGKQQNFDAFTASRDEERCQKCQKYHLVEGFLFEVHADFCARKYACSETYIGMTREWAQCHASK